MGDSLSYLDNLLVLLISSTQLLKVVRIFRGHKQFILLLFGCTAGFAKIKEAGLF